jgi:propionate CoA-transferase
MKNKIVSAEQAIAIIRDGDTLACSGFAGSGTPDELICALETRFGESGGPRELTLVFAATPRRQQRTRVEPLGARGIGKARDRRALATGD